MLAAKNRETSKTKTEKTSAYLNAKSDTSGQDKVNPLWNQLATRVQAKLTVSAPDDPYEKEADQIADQVMRMRDHNIKISSVTPSVQRVCFGREEELRKKPETGTARPAEAVPPIVQEVLRSPGQPLNAETQSFFEPRFGQDFSQVRLHATAHAAESARAMNALAYTVGQDVVFGDGEYSPHTESGRRLLSHELTHVVQQRAGTLHADGIRQVGHPYEYQAGTITTRVASGQPPEGLLDRSAGSLGGLSARVSDPVAKNASPSPAGSIQRFEAEEHREIGDDATRGAQGETKTVQLADDYRITYGEMIAMAGDHFESIDQMRTLARNPGKGEGRREEVEYVRVVHIHGLKAREEEFSKEARRAADKRYYALAARNPSHFVNPESGDMGKSTGAKAIAHHIEPEWDPQLLKWKFKELPNNAVGYYRMNHVRAIVEAWSAGRAGVSIDEAMATEAFSNHYLTDSFSAGHNRTARTSATDYWNEKLPMFFYNFKGFMAEKLAYWINDNNWRGIATVNYIWGEARKALDKTLAAKGLPDFTFGDLVSGTIHDYDNTKGIKASVDGVKKTIFGDANLHKGDTKEVAVKAVQASVMDIETAYRTGKAKTDLGALTGSLAPRGLFRAEEMIPVATPDTALDEPARAIKWDYPSAFELLSDGKFREGLKILLASKRSELAAVGQGLEEQYQKDAFKAAIVDHMAGEEGITMIWRILEWTPNTGGGIGGHNQDDNALDYYNRAKKTAGGLVSLMWSARANLIKNLVDGYTASDEEDAIFDLLVTCPSDSDVRQVIKFITWDRLEDEVGKRFVTRYPKDKYGSR